MQSIFIQSVPNSLSSDIHLLNAISALQVVLISYLRSCQVWSPKCLNPDESVTSSVTLLEPKCLSLTSPVSLYHYHKQPMLLLVELTAGCHVSYIPTRLLSYLWLTTEFHGQDDAFALLITTTYNFKHTDTIISK